jgi:CheY-like chemotaxis protein
VGCKFRQAGSRSNDAIANREAATKRLNPTPLTPADAMAKRIKIAAVEIARTPTSRTNPTCQGCGCLRIVIFIQAPTHHGLNQEFISAITLSLRTASLQASSDREFTLVISDEVKSNSVNYFVSFCPLSMQELKILVVEDEWITAKDIKNSLEKLDYAVSSPVATGEDAIQKSIELQPNLILMNIVLQGKIEGVEAAERIQKFCQIPIVFLTAYSIEKLSNVPVLLNRLAIYSNTKSIVRLAFF